MECECQGAGCRAPGSGLWALVCSTAHTARTVQCLQEARRSWLLAVCDLGCAGRISLADHAIHGLALTSIALFGLAAGPPAETPERNENDKPTGARVEVNAGSRKLSSFCFFLFSATYEVGNQKAHM